jgi:hypothetical protein
MKILFVYDSGSNCLFLRRMLDLHFSYTMVRLPEYANFNQDEFDVLIYQTFPDESHPFKFNAKAVKQGDEKFSEFKGVKVLMDSFDDGDRDAFSRMGDTSKILPRIKSVPSWSFLKEFKTVFDIPPYFGIDSIPDMEDGKRDVVLHYAPTLDVGIYSHDIRKKILNILQREFNGEVNFTRVPRRSYPNFLKRVQMSITGPGFGPCSNTFWTAMQYRALSVAEESVDRYKMLPRVSLIPDEDYVSFSLDTLVDKVRHLISHPDECEKIRKSGHQKIKEGYNVETSANDFRLWLDNL